MQTLGKAFTKANTRSLKGKPDSKMLWARMDKTCLLETNKNNTARSQKSTTCRNEKVNGDDLLHPFLVYLLQLDDEIDTPRKAFAPTTMDGSEV